MQTCAFYTALEQKSTIIHNIAFARGGAHLPIAHALHLPETEIISWGGDFFGSVVFLVGQIFILFFWGRWFFWIFLGRGFFWGRRIFLGAGDFFCFLFLNEIEIEKN